MHQIDKMGQRNIYQYSVGHPRNINTIIHQYFDTLEIPPGGSASLPEEMHHYLTHHAMPYIRHAKLQLTETIETIITKMIIVIISNYRK